MLRMSERVDDADQLGGYILITEAVFFAALRIVLPRANWFPI
jgi:hypothetical protein